MFQAHPEGFVADFYIIFSEDFLRPDINLYSSGTARQKHNYNNNFSQP